MITGGTGFARYSKVLCWVVAFIWLALAMLSFTDDSGNSVVNGFLWLAGAIAFGNLLDPESEVRKSTDDGRTYALLGYLNTRPRTTYKVSLSNPNPKLRKPVEDPFHHGHGGHGEHDDHGSDDGHGSEDNGHASFVDKMKKHEDSGYAVSLRVLGAPAGVHA